MHRRYESMTARNGDIEDLSQDETSGIGVRALVGSGWGFYAVPDLSDAAVRDGRRAGRGDRRGERAGSRGPRRARARRAGDRRLVGERRARSTRSPCRCPTRATCSCGRRRRWPSTAPTWPRRCTRSGTPRKWFVSSEGHRIDQHVRECGAGITATAIGDGETQRRSYPAARGQYGTRGWEFVDELDLEAHAARVADEARALLSRAAVPERRDDADPRRRAAGAADPRVGRPRHRARPHPRLGGGLRRHVVARPGPARLACGTARS